MNISNFGGLVIYARSIEDPLHGMTEACKFERTTAANTLTCRTFYANGPGPRRVHRALGCGPTKPSFWETSVVVRGGEDFGKIQRYASPLLESLPARS